MTKEKLQMFVRAHRRLRFFFGEGKLDDQKGRKKWLTVWRTSLGVGHGDVGVVSDESWNVRPKCVVRWLWQENFQSLPEGQWFDLPKKEADLGNGKRDVVNVVTRWKGSVTEEGTSTIGDFIDTHVSVLGLNSTRTTCTRESLGQESYENREKSHRVGISKIKYGYKT